MNQNNSIKLNVCIMSPDKDMYSETFILAHIQHLPVNVHFLYGGDLPNFTKDNKPLLVRASLRIWFIRLLLGKLFKFDYSHETLLKKAIAKYFKDNHIQVVLAEYGPTGVAVQSICLELSIPLIVHFHGYDAYESNTLRKFDNYQSLFNSASAVVTVSNDMKKQIISLGAPVSNVHHIVYGVDISKFEGAHPDNAKPVFISVGRFVDKKAPYLTILSFKKVINEISDAKLLMYGDGPLLESCQQLAKALEISHAIQFMGSRPHSEIAEAMKKARGFVQHSLKTSYGDSEGTPVAILEASASGLPVVSTLHAGISDIILNGKTGFLVSEGDISSMSEVILRLAKEPSLANQMGQMGCQYIRENFSMEKSINKLHSVIELTLTTKR
jgi:colanic acid/amylovoran biosynthesis glycosyltransferase